MNLSEVTVKDKTEAKKKRIAQHSSQFLTSKCPDRFSKRPKPLPINSANSLCSNRNHSGENNYYRKKRSSFFLQLSLGLSSLVTLNSYYRLVLYNLSRLQTDGEFHWCVTWSNLLMSSVSSCVSGKILFCNGTFLVGFWEITTASILELGCFWMRI